MPYGCTEIINIEFNCDTELSMPLYARSRGRRSVARRTRCKEI
jgi:hypothetical protein